MTKFKRAAVLFAAILGVSIGAVTPAQAASEKPPAAPDSIETVETKGKAVKIDRPLPPNTRISTRAMATCASEPRGPLCYRYAGQGRNVFLGGDAKGFDSTTTVENPVLSAPDIAAGGHTLFQLAAISGSGTTDNRVEIGWAKGQAFCAQTTSPCLYTAAWANGNLLCLNTGCGYQDNTSNPINVKSSLSADVGTSKRFLINHFTNGVDCTCTSGWWIQYDTAYVGLWPDTVWSGYSPPQTFLDMNQQQALGETAGYTPSETDIGSGVLATASAGSYVSDLDLYGSTDCDNTTTFCDWQFNTVSQSDRWNVVDTGVGEFRYGGPGGHTTINNLPAGDVCSGVGIGTAPGGFGSFCLYQNTSGGVPITQLTALAKDGAVVRNTCFANYGKLDGQTTNPIRAHENTTWVKWAWFRDANCAGAHIDVDHGRTVLPTGWTNLDHASLMRWSTVATCNTVTPNTCN